MAGFYWLGVLGAKSVGGGFSARRLAQRVRALARADRARLRGRALLHAAALPGPGASCTCRPTRSAKGSDIFGTADTQIDYTLIGANATWYWQVAFVVAGHVAALILAHDRALALYDDARQAVRSQYWMLGVMVGFTSLALWLLSSANS